MKQVFTCQLKLFLHENKSYAYHALKRRVKNLKIGSLEETPIEYTTLLAKLIANIYSKIHSWKNAFCSNDVCNNKVLELLKC